MIKIMCTNSSQFDELMYVLRSKDIKHDVISPKTKKFSVLVDFDELIEVLNEGPNFTARHDNNG